MHIRFILKPYESPTKSRFQFCSISIAEGLKQLGLPFSANVDYWYDNEEKAYLFRKSDVDGDVHVYDNSYFDEEPGVNIDKTKVNVLIDHEDKLYTASLAAKFKDFDIILRTHYTTHIPYDSRVKPWAFGLSNRIISSVDNSLQQQVKEQIMISYRVHHDVRALVNNELLPLLTSKYPAVKFESKPIDPQQPVNDHSYWLQTGKRHDEAFYVELNQSLLGFAFGGSFQIAPYPSDNKAKMLQYLHRGMLKLSPALRSKGKFQYLIQYDSWRLWETFISNACPVYLKLEDWGFVLPEMPVANKHYIALEGLDFEKTANTILSMKKEQIEAISLAGRKWAIEYYGPVAAAQRFLSLLS
jgi:hypothetical protein